MTAGLQSFGPTGAVHLTDQYPLLKHVATMSSTGWATSANPPQGGQFIVAFQLPQGVRCAPSWELPYQNMSTSQPPSGAICYVYLGGAIQAEIYSIQSVHISQAIPNGVGLEVYDPNGMVVVSPNYNYAKLGPPVVNTAPISGTISFPSNGSNWVVPIKYPRWQSEGYDCGAEEWGGVEQCFYDMIEYGLRLDGGTFSVPGVMTSYIDNPDLAGVDDPSYAFAVLRK